MTIYLTYVQPFMEMLSVEIDRGCKWSDYIWADEFGPWETQKLTDVMKRETAKRLGVTLGTYDYRHVAVFIGRDHVGKAFAKGT